MGGTAEAVPFPGAAVPIRVESNGVAGSRALSSKEQRLPWRIQLPGFARRTAEGGCPHMGTGG